jgi:hypothetical protein
MFPDTHTADRAQTAIDTTHTADRAQTAIYTTHARARARTDHYIHNIHARARTHRPLYTQHTTNTTDEEHPCPQRDSNRNPRKRGLTDLRLRTHSHRDRKHMVLLSRICSRQLHNSVTSPKFTGKRPKCYMQAAHKERNQNTDQVTRDVQWVNTETLVFWYTARHRSVLEVYRADRCSRLLRNGTCQEIM